MVSAPPHQPREVGQVSHLLCPQLSHLENGFTVLLSSEVKEEKVSMVEEPSYILYKILQ